MMNEFLIKAEQLKPVLQTERILPDGPFGKALKEGESALFDFGNHYTGHLSIRFSSLRSHQDAPAFIKIKFCEYKDEIDEDTSSYRGWISRSWIPEEYIHIDVLPETLNLKRRYAFRYVKIEVLGLSGKFDLVVDEMSALVTTSADSIVEVSGNTEELKRIDEVSLRTLRECMQYEFEDGPKRDMRLWLGDLRLQALANYDTYKKDDLVKRCLYLFAGIADKNGRMSGCLFTKPEIEADDTFMFDYSLLFNATLRDYLNATGDIETARELYSLALRQIELAKEYYSDNHVIKDSDVLGWCFLDWNLALNKQAGAQAIYIYSLKATLELAKALNEETTDLLNEIELKSKAAIDAFFDKEKGVFISGADRQISYAANVWFALAKVFSNEENSSILNNLETIEDIIKPVTPYMYHHYIQALIDSGSLNKAKEIMISYWGGMVDKGADTFWELYNPENPEESPYGSKVVNSYCHAWSCTPSYFIRKYFS